MIYLDYSATTPPHPQVTARVAEVLSQEWGNPSSIHQYGQRAALVVERARLALAALLAVTPEEIIFTSGGTEANHLAIFGVAQNYTQPQHIITSAVEHPAISAPLAVLAQRGWQITTLPVDATGRVDPETLLAHLQPNTVLVSIIYGQSEVGTLQPIAELAQICRCRGIVFHTDAVQVVGRLPVDMPDLGVDLLSLSGHKFYAPQGCGALVVRRGLALQPWLYGGGQEGGQRSGTPPVALLAGLGMAAELAQTEFLPQQAYLLNLRDYLCARLLALPGLRLTGSWSDRLPHHVSVVWQHGDTTHTGKTLVHYLNQRGVAVSSGSACASGKTQPSPVLQAMGYDDRLARCGVRFSLSHYTTKSELDQAVTALGEVLQRLTPALSWS
ncbi:class V aminotransferase [Gloeomargarita lithophora Alchichica-D10]|uniref:cysteine desulfurase n=1 Tax=Gloeomargarita lithophora Alchichica-D10 TaxID=1188229 RepID=A0A1J0AGC4_9CYAN|nr:cysteine desulfurase family protein [Gloeomargarita lithophora]APB34960.1 class V aminotransferase [Gloeomargarita lithophora Alchichica-D10]